MQFWTRTFVMRRGRRYPTTERYTLADVDAIEAECPDVTGVLPWKVFRYGSLFFLGSLGFMSVGIRLWKNSGTVLAVFVFLFMLATFFRARLETLLGASGCNTLFFVSLGCISLLLLFIAWRQRESPKHGLVYVGMVAWFLLSVALSRDAKRYDFFIIVQIKCKASESLETKRTSMTRLEKQS